MLTICASVLAVASACWLYLVVKTMLVKKSVSLVIITKLNGVYLALLQKRASWNTEKGTKESYPGCMQTSCHGKLEKGETFVQALFREAREELGENFVAKCLKNIPLRQISDDYDGRNRIITFATFVPKERLLMIQPNDDIACLVYISEDEIDQINPNAEMMKAEGPPPGVLAMFSGRIKAIRLAFEMVRMEHTGDA